MFSCRVSSKKIVQKNILKSSQIIRKQVDRQKGKFENIKCCPQILPFLTFFGWKFILGAHDSFQCARASHFSSINVADKQKRASFILVFCLRVRAFSRFFIFVLLSLFFIILCLCVRGFSTFFTYVLLSFFLFSLSLWVRTFSKSYFSVFILLYLYILCLCVRAFSTSLISCLPVHPFQKLEPCFSRSFKSSLITLWLSSNYVYILHLSFSFYKWCIVLFSLCLTLFCVCLCDQLYSRFVCYICLLILCRIFLCIFSHTTWQFLFSSSLFSLPFNFLRITYNYHF